MLNRAHSTRYPLLVDSCTGSDGAHTAGASGDVMIWLQKPATFRAFARSKCDYGKLPSVAAITPDPSNAAVGIVCGD